MRSISFENTPYNIFMKLKIIPSIRKIK